jgi:uncharacterized protein YegP (UPF0339 family)
MSRTPTGTPAPSSRTPFFELAQDHEGEWHWALWSGNGRMMARNAEGYQRRKDCLQAVKNMIALVPTVTLIAASTHEAAEEEKPSG